MIPQHTQYQIDEYVKGKVPPGNFLYAVLTNNLAETVCRADETNLRFIKDIVLYVYNNIPSVCWGTPEKVEEWLNPPNENDEAHGL